jgi:ribosomal protein S18 acetylase RimI-like enzyme
VDPFGRAWNFDRELQERSAARVRRFERGAALYTESLPRVWDGNFVRVDDARGLSAADAEALADELQGDLRHRKIVLPEDGEEAARGLRLRGWSLSRIATMRYAGPAERDGSVPAAEIVDPRAVRGAREGALADRDADVQRQVAEYTERLAHANDGLVFAAFADGEVAAFCALYQRDGVGEIDEVTTLERFRKRGLGNAVVEAALRTSLAARDELTFLNADADDWPMRWYERLGFRTVGLRYEVYRVGGQVIGRRWKGVVDGGGGPFTNPVHRHTVTPFTLLT